VPAPVHEVGWVALIREAFRLEWFTVAWMTAEADGEHDRNGRSGRLGGDRRDDRERENNTHFARDEIGRQRREPIVFVVPRAVLYGDVAALDKAGLLQALAECRDIACTCLR